MKLFLKNISLFGFILILIDIVLFSIISTTYIKPYQIVNLEYDTYLLADSHGTILYGHMEEYGIYNFSAPSESYIDMLRKIRFLIKHSDVKNIILSVDDHTLSTYREQRNNMDRSFYFEQINTEPILEKIKTKYIRHYFVLLNSKSRDVIRSYFKSYLKNLLSSPSAPSDNWKLRTAHSRQSMISSRLHHQFGSQSKSDVQSNSLQMIIEICQENRINLLGVKFPLTSEYCEALGETGFGADSVFKRNDLKIFDCKYLYENKDEYFVNQDHLNNSGAQEFSKHLFGLISAP